jgi:hypothetical protein
MQIHGLELRPASWGLRGQRCINSLVPRGHRGGNGAKQRALAAALMRLQKGRAANQRGLISVFRRNGLGLGEVRLTAPRCPKLRRASGSGRGG